jgi:hypothetical protein
MRADAKETRRRPPPAAASRRKPQTGLPPGQERRRGPVVSGRLAYLVQIYDQGELEGLVAQELAVWRRSLDAQPRRNGPPIGLLPSPLTAAVRLRPDSDPALRLDAASLRRRFPDQAIRFDAEQPAVAVSTEFLGQRTDLPPMGFIPVSQSGDIVIGWVNLARVMAFAEHRAVVRIDALRVLAPTGGGGSASADGLGVRIACVDMGFDFEHPGLLQDVGGHEHVRAVSLHDMVLAPVAAAPTGSIPGRRFTEGELQTALEWYNGSPQSVRPAPDAVELHLGRLRDPPGNVLYKAMLQQHGTAVIGIAAGNGRGSGPGAVTGVAPAADLLLVALGAHDEQRFADCTQISAAFDIAFSDPSTPYVALMANSDNLGPHDGSLHGERALDDRLLWPGRAIVLTAGNLNHQPGGTSSVPPFHALSDPDGGGPPQPLVLRYGSGGSWPDSAEVWFRPPPGVDASAEISMKVRANSFDPFRVVPGTPTVILNPKMVPFSYTTVTALIERDDDADAWCLRLFFRPDPGQSIAPSVWTITVPAIGPVHGWLDRNNEGVGRWEGQTADAGANYVTLGSPSTALRPLTVGSVANLTGQPSVFSGRGPVREEHVSTNLKPDLVAVGENVPAPLGDPADRWHHQHPAGTAYATFLQGTSYAAPRVAGACALLFQSFGPAATWADIRQAILQAVVRTPAMPASNAVGWDPSCGFGMLDDVTRLPVEPSPRLLTSDAAPEAALDAVRARAADLWLAKASGDDGSEPFVAHTFWDSPALVLLDAEGREIPPVAVAAGQAKPVRLRVRVGNRGGGPASGGTLEVWWAPLGALYPLPRPGQSGASWRANLFGINGSPGNRQRLPELPPGGIADLDFDWVAPTANGGGVEPHMLLATVDCAEDPFDPNDTLCAQNNAAALSVAVWDEVAPVRLYIKGTDDTDWLALWHDDRSARLTVLDLPIAALPWRDAAMFQASGSHARPLYDALEAKHDPALRSAVVPEGAAAITAVTDVIGAERLILRNGRVSIEGGAGLTLPRLRIAESVDLILQVAVTSGVGDLHALHLSGGRRVGGCTVRMTPKNQ